MLPRNRHGKRPGEYQIPRPLLQVLGKGGALLFSVFRLAQFFVREADAVLYLWQDIKRIYFFDIIITKNTGRNQKEMIEGNLLVVEDDKFLQEIIADYFDSKNWRTDTAEDGDTALEKMQVNTYHMVLLDVMLPGMNGFTVCRKIREISDVPVIFITARVQEEDELNGYSTGADDYVTKPFSLPVLYAKVTALTKRAKGNLTTGRLRCGEVEADIHTREIWVQGYPCLLPPKETDILIFFMENPNRIFSREQLLIRFWGYDFDGNERVVDNHIKKLRKAMGVCGEMIQTVRKSGYRLKIL